MNFSVLRGLLCCRGEKFDHFILQRLQFYQKQKPMIENNCSCELNLLTIIIILISIHLTVTGYINITETLKTAENNLCRYHDTVD